jgi:hypothetical protein
MALVNQVSLSISSILNTEATALVTAIVTAIQLQSVAMVSDIAFLAGTGGNVYNTAVLITSAATLTEHTIFSTLVQIATIFGINASLIEAVRPIPIEAIKLVSGASIVDLMGVVSKAITIQLSSGITLVFILGKSPFIHVGLGISADDEEKVFKGVPVAQVDIIHLCCESWVQTNDVIDSALFVHGGV